MNEGLLEVMVAHDCVKPHLADPSKQHRFVCVCGSKWDWCPPWFGVGRVERYGFLWLKSREVGSTLRGHWMLTHRPVVWEPVAPQVAAPTCLACGHLAAFHSLSWSRCTYCTCSGLTAP